MYKFSALLFLVVSAGLVSCASAPASNNDAARARAHAGYADLDAEVSGQISENSAVTTTCEDDSFLRGEGVAETSAQAALRARQEIAMQIQSRIESVNSLQETSDVGADGKEMFASSYKSSAKVYANLENAQDAKIIYSKREGSQYRAVACMSREDARKPFRKQALEQRDSLSMAVAAIQEATHPLRVKELFLAAQAAYGRYAEAAAVLDDSKADSVARNLYETALTTYRDFQTHYKFYYAPGDDDLENTVFARLSEVYPVTGGECQSGLQLNLDVSEVKCKDGGFGISCSVNLSLRGSSCNGEDYFSLNATVKGSGKYSEDEARERLLNVVGSGDWFNAWTTELDKWKF